MKQPRVHLPTRLVAAVLAGLVVVVVVLLRSGGDAHHLTISVTDATNVIPGQEIRLAGIHVGEVGAVNAVDRGKRARLRLDLENRVWPLRRGTRIALRWGGTISYSNRYLALLPSSTGTQYAEGDEIPPSDFRAPGEFDATLRTFSPTTRRDLRAMLANSSVAVRRAAPALRSALDSAPPAVRGANLLLTDLVSDQVALRTLIRSTDQVVDAAMAANPTMGRMVTGGATTLRAVAAEARALQQGLSLAPATLRTARGTLDRANRTLAVADRLAVRLAPGVTEARRIARPLNDTLATLQRVAPDATATLGSVRRALPHLDPILRLVTKRLPQIGSISSQSVEQLKCIRPYTPDIVAFMTNWADFMSPNDGVDRYLRANVEAPLPMVTNLDSRAPAEAVKDSPDLRYAFPRPPGHNAGQPWFLPECGAGRDALDPSKDPEARHAYPIATSSATRASGGRP